MLTKTPPTCTCDHDLESYFSDTVTESHDGEIQFGVQCDNMCDTCSSRCTRDWGHSGAHRCDSHSR